MTSGDSHCVLKTSTGSLSTLCPWEREKLSLSQLVCLLKYKGCLLFKQSCGLADIILYLCNKKLSISPAAECKMEACLATILANQQRGHLQGRWAQKHHGRCSHNRQDQHAAASLCACSYKMKLPHEHGVQAHKYEQINGQQHALTHRKLHHAGHQYTM